MSKLLEKKRMDNHDAKRLEVLTAENEELRADLEFLAIMTDVEIPGDTENVEADMSEVTIDE